MRKLKPTILIMAVLLPVLAACSQAAAPAANENLEIPVVLDDFAVVAEGRLVPAESVRLAFVTS